MIEPDIPVLIVGAGPVGLALAGDLGWRGVPATVVEQSDGAIGQPRMDLVGIRTMEFCRRWGLSQAVREAPYPQDYGQDFVFVTAITGHEIARDRRPTRRAAKPPDFSPERRERCPQHLFDPILRRFVESLATCRLLHRHRLVSFTQDAEGVTARVEALEAGRTETIRARWLAACDGAGSTVRRAAGARMLGNARLTHSLNVLIRCPAFNTLHDKGEAYRFILVGAEGVWATMVAIDGGARWRFQYVGGPETLTLDEAGIRALIHRAMGRPFDFEILSVMPWTRRQIVADRYRFGNVFLVGDAAHEMSPTGAFGMNTGIGEAVDLSWKLAATREGWGGAGLLDTYDIERRPVARRNVDEAAGNLGRMVGTVRDPHLLDETAEGEAVRRRVGAVLAKAMEREYRADGIHVGYRYDDSPLIIPDGTPAPPDDPVAYAQTARPGARAPHVWLGDGRSSLDLYGSGFVLLDLAGGAGDPGLIAAARMVKVPLSVVGLDEPAMRAAYERRFVLVRPDGHVAWRSDHAPVAPQALIDRVRGEGIARTAQGAA